MAQVMHAPTLSPDGQPITDDVFERHNTSLRIIRLMFVELDEMIAEGDEVSDAEWAGWSPVWDNEMFRLTKLAEARASGILTLYQEVLLSDILALLEQERPRLVARQLYGPIIPAINTVR